MTFLSTGRDTAKIIVPFNNAKIDKLWAKSELWQRVFSNFFKKINNCYPKSKRIQLIKRTNWILSHIVWDTPMTGESTFLTDANKLGKVDYKSKNLSKVDQSSS